MNESERGLVLLTLARGAIAEQFGATLTAVVSAPHEAWLDTPGATFVTLMRHGQLRGCVGSVHAHRPLLEDVRTNAVGAAFHDYRFAPLREVEFPDTLVEVSLLSPAQPLLFNSEKAAQAQLRPGMDGVIFECGHQRSTFLPQVWETLPDAALFMEQLKLKAGLPADFWSPEVKLSVYTVQKWKEHDAG